MTKADIVNKITKTTGVARTDVLITLECFFQEVKNSVKDGKEIYVRGFGSFQKKTRKPKLARDIRRNKLIMVPAHEVPTFKPSKIFAEMLKTKSHEAGK